MTEALVERVAIALDRDSPDGLDGEDAERMAKAAIEAMGGERVWRHKETGAVIFGLRQRQPHFAPAMLIPLGESDG